MSEMDDEEAMRLTVLYGTCSACGSPMTTRMRLLQDVPAPGQQTTLEEIVCSIDPNHQQRYERHEDGDPVPKIVYLLFLNPSAATIWSFDDLKQAQEAADAVIGGGVIIALPIFEDRRR